jgi:membrane associated rhomboid family serine protease
MSTGRVWKSGCAGMLLFGAGGAICGATGLVRMEYKASRLDQAIMVGWSGACYGLLAGLALACVAKFVRRAWAYRPNRRP